MVDHQLLHFGSITERSLILYPIPGNLDSEEKFFKGSFEVGDMIDEIAVLGHFGVTAAVLEITRALLDCFQQCYHIILYWILEKGERILGKGEGKDTAMIHIPSEV